ncbi:MAG: nicotinate phosphoribosyltransferase, partial [Tremellales sp. Tagirdzhanova-0007]
MNESLAIPSDQVEIPYSILDTDLYKFTMQCAVLHHFYDAIVTIKFTNRSPQMLFSRESFDWIQERINRLSTLQLTRTERSALCEACPYFPPSYLDYLSSLILRPQDQVKLTFIPKEGEMGELECLIEGVWRDCIIYEVPIMSIMSEAYFKFVDTDWDLNDVVDQARLKALALLSPPSPIQPLLFTELGTRRRRSFRVHDLVVQGLVKGSDEWKASNGKVGGLGGTSNVSLEMDVPIPILSTFEIHVSALIIVSALVTSGSWRLVPFMDTKAPTLEAWRFYPRGPYAPPLTMLTDTFTAHTFFAEFIKDTTRAIRWGSLRQDSGDPFEFVKKAKEVWAKVEEKAGLKSDDGVVAKGKRVLFTDSLDVEKAIQLQKCCDELEIGASFGIGTSLTNDFQKASNPSKTSKPLNIVIKLSTVDGKNCVKLSDDKGKHTGDLDEVKRVQKELNLPEARR